MDKILSIIAGNGKSLLTGISDIIGKFKGDPTKIAELEQDLQKAVMAHTESMESLAVKELEVLHADRASARNREVSLKNTFGVYVQNVSAGILVIAFCVMLFFAMYREIPANNKEIFYTLLGILGTLNATIFNYWFGSSQGSANKEKRLHDFLDTQNFK